MSSLEFAVWRAKVAPKPKLRIVPKPKPKAEPKPSYEETLSEPIRIALEALYKAIDFRPEEPPRIPPRVITIQQTVADYYSVRHLDLVGSSREKPIIRPRFVAMYLAKKLTVHSLPEIGRRFGGREHTTVLHAVRKITTRMQYDRKLVGDLAELERRIVGD